MDVDLGKRRLYLRETQNGTLRVLPFSDSATAVLNSPDDTVIRDIVDEEASRQVYEYYLKDQESTFLKTLSKREVLDTLLRLLPANVLTFSAIRAVSR